MTNFIKTTAQATLVALIAAAPMASVAATVNDMPNDVFTEVLRDALSNSAEAATVLMQGDTTGVPAAISPRIGNPQPTDVSFPGYGDTTSGEIAGRR